MPNQTFVLKLESRTISKRRNVQREPMGCTSFHLEIPGGFWCGKVSISWSSAKCCTLRCVAPVHQTTAHNYLLPNLPFLPPRHNHPGWSHWAPLGQVYFEWGKPKHCRGIKPCSQTKGIHWFPRDAFVCRNLPKCQQLLSLAEQISSRKKNLWCSIWIYIYVWITKFICSVYRKPKCVMC